MDFFKYFLTAYHAGKVTIFQKYIDRPVSLQPKGRFTSKKSQLQMYTRKETYLHLHEILQRNRHHQPDAYGPNHSEYARKSQHKCVK